MVAAVHPGLDVEQLLGHAEVRHEVGRQLAERVEERREDALPGADERVASVGDVEGHRPVVGVGHDLDAVPDVVERVVAEAGRARSDGSNDWAFGNWSLMVKASWTYFSRPLPSITRYGSLS